MVKINLSTLLIIVGLVVILNPSLYWIASLPQRIKSIPEWIAGVPQWITSIPQWIATVPEQQVAVLDYNEEKHQRNSNHFLTSRKGLLVTQSEMLAYSNELREITLLTAEEMQNQNYKVWLEFVNEGKKLSTQYYAIHLNMEQGINEMTHVIRKFEALRRNSTDTEAQFVEKLKYNLPKFRKALEAFVNTTKTTTKNIDLALSMGRDLYEQAQHVNTTYEKMLTNAKEGWTHKDYLKVYGAALMAIGVPGKYVSGWVASTVTIAGIGFPAPMIAGSAALLGVSTALGYQLYDTKVVRPEIIQDCHKIFRRVSRAASTIQVANLYHETLREKFERILITTRDLEVEVSMYKYNTHSVFMDAIDGEFSTINRCYQDIIQPKLESGL